MAVEFIGVKWASGSGVEAVLNRKSPGAKNIKVLQEWEYYTAENEGQIEIFGSSSFPKMWSALQGISTTGALSGTYSNYVMTGISSTSETKIAGGKKLWRFGVTYEWRYSDKFKGEANIQTATILPWNQPVRGYTASAIEIAEPFEWAYNASNEPVVPVITAAGTPILANTTRNIGVRNFSYYIQDNVGGDFDLTIDALRGSVNAGVVTICDVTYPAEAVRLADIKATSLKTRNEITGATENEYIDISVTLQIDQRQWVREFASLSTWFVGTNGPEEIYVAAADGSVSYGGKEAMQALDPNAQPISEPMFIHNTTGAILTTPLSSGNRANAYLSFYEYPAYDWSALRLPLTRY